MKSLKQFNKTNDQLNQLDEETRESLSEISIGKISTTVLIGRLKLLTRKIKDTTISKSLMTLGYIIYTVSLQSKSLNSIETKLDQLIKISEKNQLEIQRMKIKNKI